MENNLANYIKTNFPQYSRESITNQLLQAGHSVDSINHAWQIVETKQMNLKPAESAWLKQPLFWLTAIAVAFLTPIALYVFTNSLDVLIARIIIPPLIYFGIYKAGVALYPQQPAFGKGLSVGILLAIILPICWGLTLIIPTFFSR